MVIYLEYARRLPHTGGEVIYVSLSPKSFDPGIQNLMMLM